jgi:signal transduction histidine kinase
VTARTATSRDRFAALAFERARVLAAFLFVGMIWYTAFDDVIGLPLTGFSLVYDVVALCTLGALGVLLWLRRVPRRFGHVLLAFAWGLAASTTLQELYFYPKPELALLVLLEIMAVAVMLDARIAIACLAVLDAALLVIVSQGALPAWETYVVGFVVAEAIALVLQRVFARAVATAERMREIEAETAASLEQRLEDLARSRRERELLSAQLAASQRMEAAGTLAASLAHEVKNILTGITLTASLLARRTAGEARADFETIMAESERGARWTRSLLAFSRRGRGPREVEAFDEVVNRGAELVGRALPPMVRLDVNAMTRAHVACDVVQIHQLMVNVALNAAEAMQGTGVVEIGATVELLDDAEAKPRGIRAGTYVRMHVRDHGRGMDAATRARAFDPFFTTKQMGNGTGLGLSTAWGIVQAHDGAIAIGSRPDHGTTVTIHLPVVSAVVEQRPVRGVEAEHG